MYSSIKRVLSKLARDFAWDLMVNQLVAKGGICEGSNPEERDERVCARWRSQREGQREAPRCCGDL